MNLYLISQDYLTQGDHFNSAVVVAANEEEARRIHPNGRAYIEDMESHCHGHIGSHSESVRDTFAYWCQTWCVTPDKVSVTLIGKAVDTLEPRSVIVASFREY
jgi:hypothetical protein